MCSVKVHTEEGRPTRTKASNLAGSYLHTIRRHGIHSDPPRDSLHSIVNVVFTVDRAEKNQRVSDVEAEGEVWCGIGLTRLQNFRGKVNGLEVLERSSG